MRIKNFIYSKSSTKNSSLKNKSLLKIAISKNMKKNEKKVSSSNVTQIKSYGQNCHLPVVKTKSRKRILISSRGSLYQDFCIKLKQKIINEERDITFGDHIEFYKEIHVNSFKNLKNKIYLIKFIFN